MFHIITLTAALLVQTVSPIQISHDAIQDLPNGKFQLAIELNHETVTCTLERFYCTTPKTQFVIGHLGKEDTPFPFDTNNITTTSTYITSLQHHCNITTTSMLHHNNISNNINNNITNNINNNISNNIAITSLTTSLQQHYNSTKTVLFIGSQFFENSSVVSRDLNEISPNLQK